MFGFPSPWALLCYSAVPQLVTKNFGVQVDISSALFPHFLPPRNAESVGGWLVGAARQDSWSHRCGAEGAEVTCHKPVLRDCGQSAAQTRSSDFQPYMWGTQELLKHGSAKNVSFFLRRYSVLLPNGPFFIPLILTALF